FRRPRSSWSAPAGTAGTNPSDSRPAIGSNFPGTGCKMGRPRVLRPVSGPDRPSPTPPPLPGASGTVTAPSPLKLPAPPRPPTPPAPPTPPRPSTPPRRAAPRTPRAPPTLAAAAAPPSSRTLRRRHQMKNPDGFNGRRTPTPLRDTKNPPPRPAVGPDAVTKHKKPSLAGGGLLNAQAWSYAVPTRYPSGSRRNASSNSSRTD